MAADYRDPDAWTVLTVAIVGAVLTVASVVALQALYYQVEESENRAKVVARPPRELTMLRENQTRKLEQYRFVSREAGLVEIPIERAMELTVRDLAVAEERK